jgi:hypothetical protein
MQLKLNFPVEHGTFFHVKSYEAIPGTKESEDNLTRKATRRIHRTSPKDIARDR